MEALDRATIGLLRSTKPLSRASSPNKAGTPWEEGGGGAAEPQEGAAIERMVLLPLEELYKQVAPSPHLHERPAA